MSPAHQRQSAGVPSPTNIHPYTQVRSGDPVHVVHCLLTLPHSPGAVQVGAAPRLAAAAQGAPPRPAVVAPQSADAPPMFIDALGGCPRARGDACGPVCTGKSRHCAGRPGACCKVRTRAALGKPVSIRHLHQPPSPTPPWPTLHQSQPLRPSLYRVFHHQAARCNDLRGTNSARCTRCVRAPCVPAPPELPPRPAVRRDPTRPTPPPRTAGAMWFPRQSQR